MGSKEPSEGSAGCGLGDETGCEGAESAERRS